MNFKFTPDERRTLELLAAKRATTMTAVVADLLRQAERTTMRHAQLDAPGQVAGRAVEVTA